MTIKNLKSVKYYAIEFLDFYFINSADKKRDQEQMNFIVLSTLNQRIRI